MKKIMIALAAVAFAAVAHAASVDWSIEGIQTTGDFDSGEGDYAVGYLVYLFNDATLSQSTMAGYIADAATGKTDWKTALSDSSLSSFKANSDGGGNVMGLSVADGDFKGYLVILDAGTVDAAEYAYITSNYTVADNSTHKISFGDFDGDGYVNALDYSIKGQDGSNWTAVPEPTSGLLLLLGVAGLALKRKRA